MYPYSEKVGSASAARYTLKKKNKTILKNFIFRTAVKRELLTMAYILIALSKQQQQQKLLQNFPTRTLFLSTGIQKL